MWDVHKKEITAGRAFADDELEPLIEMIRLQASMSFFILQQLKEAIDLQRQAIKLRGVILGRLDYRAKVPGESAAAAVQKELTQTSQDLGKALGKASPELSLQFDEQFDELEVAIRQNKTNLSIVEVLQQHKSESG